MRRVLLLLLSCMVSFGFSITAYVIEEENISQTPYGVVKKSTTTFIAKGYVKEVNRESGGGSDIVNLRVFKDGKVIEYTLMPKMKTYRKREMDAAVALAMAVAFFYDCDQSGCKPKTSGKDFIVTKEFKKVGKWKARKIVSTVNLAGMPQKSINWVAKDNTLQSATLLRFSNLFESAKDSPRVKANPKYMKLLKDMKKRVEEMIKKYGAVVETETEVNMGMGGVKTTTRVKKVTKKDVPEAFFKIPPDYTEMGARGGYRY